MHTAALPGRERRAAARTPCTHTVPAHTAHDRSAGGDRWSASRARPKGAHTAVVPVTALRPTRRLAQAAQASLASRQPASCALPTPALACHAHLLQLREPSSASVPHAPRPLSLRSPPSLPRPERPTSSLPAAPRQLNLAHPTLHIRFICPHRWPSRYTPCPLLPSVKLSAPSCSLSSSRPRNIIHHASTMALPTLSRRQISH